MPDSTASLENTGQKIYKCATQKFVSYRSFIHFPDAKLDFGHQVMAVCFDLLKDVGVHLHHFGGRCCRWFENRTLFNRRLHGRRSKWSRRLCRDRLSKLTEEVNRSNNTRLLIKPEWKNAYVWESCKYLFFKLENNYKKCEKAEYNLFFHGIKIVNDKFDK